METVETVVDFAATNYDLKSLIPDSEKLSEIFGMMQKQFGHRLSKISLLVIKMGDVSSINNSGCKWVIKENDSRAPEIASSLDSGCEGQTAEVLKHSTVLGEIEQRAANILRKRITWLENFVEKIEMQCEVLDKFYEELSEYTVKDLDNQEMQLANLYKDFYAEKAKYIDALRPSKIPSSSSSNYSTRPSNEKWDVSFEDSIEIQPLSSNSFSRSPSDIRGSDSSSSARQSFLNVGKNLYNGFRSVFSGGGSYDSGQTSVNIRKQDERDDLLHYLDIESRNGGESRSNITNSSSSNIPSKMTKMMDQAECSEGEAEFEENGHKPLSAFRANNSSCNNGSANGRSGVGVIVIDCDDEGGTVHGSPPPSSTAGERKTEREEETQLADSELTAFREDSISYPSFANSSAGSNVGSHDRVGSDEWDGPRGDGCDVVEVMDQSRPNVHNGHYSEDNSDGEVEVLPSVSRHQYRDSAGSKCGRVGSQSSAVCSLQSNGSNGASYPEPDENRNKSHRSTSSNSEALRNLDINEEEDRSSARHHRKSKPVKKQKKHNSDDDFIDNTEEPESDGTEEDVGGEESDDDDFVETKKRKAKKSSNHSVKKTGQQRSCRDDTPEPPIPRPVQIMSGTVDLT